MRRAATTLHEPLHRRHPRHENTAITTRLPVLALLTSLVVGTVMATPAPAAAATLATQQASLAGATTKTGDAFGFSVAVSGATAVVGAMDHKGGGAAYVFTRSGTSWSEQAQLRGVDTVAGDEFGYSVAISGATIVVGAPHHVGDGVTGAAYVFVRSGTKWSQQFELHALNAGTSVAVNGSTAAVGCTNSAGTGLGAALVYARTGTTWAHQATLRSGVQNDGFGTSLSVSGGELVVGANAGGLSLGYAYFYGRSGTTWTRQAKLTGTGTTASDDFGQSVALSGTTAVVGAPLHANGKGAVYVFAEGTAGWAQQAKLTEGSPVADDMFGWSVGLSGDEAVAGAYQRGGTGAAFTFVAHNSVWSHHSLELAAATTIGDEVGWSVAQSGTTSLVGATSASNGAGSAYVFVG